MTTDNCTFRNTQVQLLSVINSAVKLNDTLIVNVSTNISSQYIL